MLDGVVVPVMDGVTKVGIEKLDRGTDLILMIGPERITEATSPLPNQ